MLLIKGIEVYGPERLGKKDVFIADEKITRIMECGGEPLKETMGVQVIDGCGKVMIPGLIDQHVHITGGGGEGSFHTRTPEIQFSEIVRAGITTIMGLLGTDGITRSVENLYAKAAALTEEGITAYLYTGSYGWPGPTITGSPDRDIVFIREVLGLKLAISDHRAPNLPTDEFIKIASAVRVAGMISGKSAVMVLHMGDAESGLAPVFEALGRTAIPVKLFRPTHMNRNPRLLEEGYRLLGQGGYMDLTCGMAGQPSPCDCIKKAMERKLPLEHITVSSDGQGSWSNYDEAGNLLEIGVSGVSSVFGEFQKMTRSEGFAIEDALPYFTSNVAKGLGLYPRKGCIREGADADFVILDKDLGIQTVAAKGQLLLRDCALLKAGTYEKIPLNA